MRDATEIETGHETVASGEPVSADVSRRPEEPDRSERELVPGDAKSEPGARRGLRWIWAVLSLLFVLGLVVSTTLMRSERNRALDRVVEQARGEARSVAAAMNDKQLVKPVSGSSYDKLAAKIWRSVSTKGSIASVTVWSSRGRVTFSSDESLVGTNPREMRPLIAASVQGSDEWRVLDDTVQTFTSVSEGSKAPVAVVEIDQPLAVAEARVGGSWSMVRLGSAVGLAVALLLLALTFFPSGSAAQAPKDNAQSEGDVRPEGDQQHEGNEDAEVVAEQQPDDPPIGPPDPLLDVPVPGLEETSAPGLEETSVPGLEETPETVQPDLDQAVDEILQPHVDQAVEHDGGLEDDLGPQESMRQWREEFKARAKQAELRLKKLEGELHEAQSAPGPER